MFVLRYSLSGSPNVTTSLTFTNHSDLMEEVTALLNGDVSYNYFSWYKKESHV